MDHPSRLDDLLRRWQEAQQRGEAIAVEDLAREDPKLLVELKEQIGALERLGHFVQVRTARASEADQSIAEDLRRVLRRRLIAIVLLCLIYAALDWSFLFVSSRTDADRTPLALVYAIPAAILGGVLALLLAGRGLSLTILRGIELGIFALISVALIFGESEWLGGEWVQTMAASGPGDKLSALLGDSIGSAWFLAIVLYGTCIPNSGRRCAAVVAGIAAAALIGLIFVRSHGTVAQVEWETIAARTVFWLALAGAIAVYGSHRLSTLRREVSEAKRMGQYVLKRFLGAGGMGEVFLAEHQLLRRLCAMKIIRPERLGDATSFQRFEREVTATASLTHGSIVEIYDYGRTEDGLFYYVMEYLPGRSLQDLLDRHGALPPARVVHLLRQLCWGLREAHGRGMIHRDIKPANILVCERGGLYDVAKLLDFGLVKAAQSPRLTQSGSAGIEPSPGLTTTDTVVGTPRYMSPEQIAGRPLDGRSDLYSLGLVAYVALAGKYPFRGESFRDFAIAHQFTEVPALTTAAPQVGPELGEIVMRCLAKDPAERFADAEALERALADCPCVNAWTPPEAAAWWRTHEPDLASTPNA